jgi:NADPH-dependent ferric siderophore reductase
MMQHQVPPADRGEGRGGRGGGRPGNRPPPRQVEVVAVDPLTDRMVAITFGGESLRGFGPPAPTAHIKVFVPDADGILATPVVGESGLEWPNGRPTMRTYTPRRFDPEALTLEVWFVLHGEGPAAVWAAQAGPGDRAAIGGPGGRFALDPDAREWWIAGDESSLPAVATLLEALPADAVAEVHLEVEDAADEIELAGPAGLTVVWHHRAGRTPGASLVEAARAAVLGDDASVWVGCEALAVRDLRRHLLVDRGLDHTRVTTRGYWSVGAANHPDHDYGED